MRLVSLLVILLAVHPLNAANWPRLRGPAGAGTAETTGLPVEFGLGKSVVWRVDLPPGKSSPILTDDRIFVTAHEGGKLSTICLERVSGKLLWRREIIREREEKRNRRSGPAAPTPVTDGKAVYSFFADFGLVAYDLDGKELWRLPLGPFQSDHGMVASPVVAEGKLYLVADLMFDSYVTALDAATGKTLWKVDRPNTLGGYATPVVYRPSEGPRELIVPGPFQLVSYHADSGKKLWWVSGIAHQPKSVPVIDGDRLYFNVPGLSRNYPPYSKMLEQFDGNSDGAVTRDEFGKKAGWFRNNFPGFDLNRNSLLEEDEWTKLISAESALWAVRLGGRGDVTSTHVLWDLKKSLPDVPSPLIADGVLYLVRNGGILTTVDPQTGQVFKRGRLKEAIDTFYSSPVAGDGKVYAASEKGKVVVVQAGQQWEVLATHDLGEEIYATPALADGRLYLRTMEALYCFKEADLVTAARLGDAEKVKALLAEGGSPTTVLTTALSAAERANHLDIAGLLRKSGAAVDAKVENGAIQVSAELLESYAGVYRHERGWKMEFIVDEGVFLLHNNRGDQAPEPVGPARFRMPGDTPWTLKFHVEDGKVTSVTSTWRDEPAVLKRVEK